MWGVSLWRVQNVATDPKALKPHKTFEQQLALLESRGLQVADRATALADLQRLGYYRLSGYFYPLRRTHPVGMPGRQDLFEATASFELIVALAEFDKRLRLLALDAIESVEIAVRVAIAYRLGRLDPLAHLQPRLLDGRFTAPRPGRATSDHEDWIVRFEKLCRDSKEDFMQHHRAAYGGHVPIWAAIEVWDFGLLSKFFAGMASRDQNAIAHQLRLGQGDVLASWLRTLNFVRNVSAHHSRLWNRRSPSTLKLPAGDASWGLSLLRQHPDSLSRVFGALTALSWLLHTIAPASDWRQRLRAHTSTFPASPLLSLAAAGFPEGWELDPLWA